MSICITKIRQNGAKCTEIWDGTIMNSSELKLLKTKISKL